MIEKYMHSVVSLLWKNLQRLSQPVISQSRHSFSCRFFVNLDKINNSMNIINIKIRAQLEPTIGIWDIKLLAEKKIFTKPIINNNELINFPLLIFHPLLQGHSFCFWTCDIKFVICKLPNANNTLTTILKIVNSENILQVLDSRYNCNRYNYYTVSRIFFMK